MKDPIEQIKRGTVEIVSEEELQQKLAAGKPLRIKAGFDPTAPDLHLGHVVLLQKLRVFQQLGHKILFLIGDFTALIGDPSGRNETRPQLGPQEIKTNVNTYKEQVFKVLDPKETEVVYNSQWLKKLTAEDLIRLASRYNVARMLERDDFEKRYKAGHSIAVHEFLYPLIQGYDSVEMKADVELGGTDQKFNLLVGRHLQREFGQKPQVIITVPLLVGTDGVQKMSKSYGNAIGIQEPAQDMYGKLMSISDELMWDYYELLTDRTTGEIRQMRQEVAAGSLHPKQAKVGLAKEIVSRFHSQDAAAQAEAEFEKVFAAHQLPSDIEVVTLQADGKDYPLAKLIADIGLAKSNSEVRRLISQGGVKLNEERVADAQLMIPTEGEYLIQVGKRRFKRVQFAD